MAPAVVVVVVGATNNADGWQKKIRQMHPVCLTRLAPTGFWRGGAAKREQGESEVIRRHSSFPLQTRGRVTVGAVFFSQCTPRPDLHTPIGLRGARKKGGRRRSTQGNGRQPRVIWRRRRSPPEKRALHRVTTLAGGQAGGRAAAKPINVNPAAGKLTSSCCVLPYCRHLL